MDLRSLYAPRDKHKAWNCLGLSDQSRQQYSEFYRAAMGINRLLVDKAKADDQTAALRREVFYYTSLCNARGIRPATDAASLLRSLETQSDAIDIAMNDPYQSYGRAFDDNWNKGLLTGIDGRIATVAARIDALRRQTAEAIAAISREAQKVSPWSRRR